MTQAQTQQTETVPHSKYVMLRCLIAIAHVDGIMHEEEMAYISAIMNRIPLSEEQRTQLETDFDEVQDIFELFKHINDPSYRSQVLYFARITAHKDGNLDAREDDVLQKLHALITENLDIDEIKKKVDSAVQAKMAAHDITIDENRPHKGKHFVPWMQLLDEVLLFLGIDLLRD